MRVYKVWSLIIFAVLLTTTGNGGPITIDYAQESAPTSSIPPELSHAADFVEFLKKAGLTVHEVKQSHLSGMLGTHKLAAFVKTDKGIVEVVFFPEATDAEKITVTYRKGTTSSERHIYLINGEAVTGKSETVSTLYPMYITLHNNWLIVTSECDLDSTIKRALLQTNRGAREELR